MPMPVTAARAIRCFVAHGRTSTSPGTRDARKRLSEAPKSTKTIRPLSQGVADIDDPVWKLLYIFSHGRMQQQKEQIFLDQIARAGTSHASSGAGQGWDAGRGVPKRRNVTRGDEGLQ